MHRTRSTGFARAVRLVGLTVLLLLAPAASAQTIGEQVEALAGHAEEQAGGATEAPPAFVQNATTPQYQGEQVNFTGAWTCDTAEAVDPAVRQALVDQGLCRPVEDAATEEEDDEEQQAAQDQAAANAEELGNDTATAIEDEAAAAEAFVNGTIQDPENATDHLFVFVNRTITFLERLLGLPGQALGGLGEVLGDLVDEGLEALEAIGELPVRGGTWVVDGLATVATGLADGATTATVGVADATTAAVAGIADVFTGGAKATGDGVSKGASGIGDGMKGGTETIGQVAQATLDGVQAVGQAVGQAVTDAVHAVWPGTDRGGGGVTEKVDGLEKGLDGGLGGGVDLPVKVP